MDAERDLTAMEDTLTGSHLHSFATGLGVLVLL